jgi:hypothetical protein
LVGVLLALVALSWTTAAHAWLELAVRSDNVTIDVARSGEAIVAHELLLHLRGGPLKEITVDGVDADAVVLQDATITRARGGQIAGAPIPLTLEVIDGQLHGTLQLKKGVRGGTYLVRFRYQSTFEPGEELVGDGSWALVRWKGPRFDSGIDSVRVLLRVPHAAEPPELPSGRGGVTEEADGVFLSTTRRSGDIDEIEIVRPHVAKKEEVTWRARVAKDAFDVELGAPAIDLPAVPPAPERVPRGPASRDPRALLWAGLGMLVFGILVGFKGRAVVLSCRRRGATPRGLLAGRPVLRAALAGLALGGAVYVGWATEWPTVAGGLLAVAMVVAATLPPRARAPLRGPGRWEEASPDVAFAEQRRSIPLLARVFDAGDLLGFAVFALLLVGFGLGSALVLRASAYHGVMLALCSGCLFPLFCTGRAAELPPEPLGAARARLEAMYERLRKRGISVSPRLRRPDAGGSPDELRLAVTPKRPLRGFLAIEVGLDEHRGGGGSLPLPFVIVRLQDASPALSAMPTGLLWTRGRDADERVAVLRPRLPTHRLTLALVLDAVATLSAPAPGSSSLGAQVRSKTARSSGRGDSTAKAPLPSAPAHAT